MLNEWLDPNGVRKKGQNFETGLRWLKKHLGITPNNELPHSISEILSNNPNGKTAKSLPWVLDRARRILGGEAIDEAINKDLCHLLLPFLKVKSLLPKKKTNDSVLSAGSSSAESKKHPQAYSGDSSESDGKSSAKDRRTEMQLSTSTVEVQRKPKHPRLNEQFLNSGIFQSKGLLVVVIPNKDALYFKALHLNDLDNNLVKEYVGQDADGNNTSAKKEVNELVHRASSRNLGRF